MFVNTRQSAERLQIFLTDWDVDARYIHEKVDDENRAKSIHLFNNKEINVPLLM